MKYDMTLSFLNHADQEVKVTTAEDGGIMVSVSELKGKEEFRLYLNGNDADTLIEMINKLHNHTQVR
jgi:hypothetical protein